MTRRAIADGRRGKSVLLETPDLMSDLRDTSLGADILAWEDAIFILEL